MHDEISCPVITDTQCHCIRRYMKWHRHWSREAVEASKTRLPSQPGRECHSRKVFYMKIRTRSYNFKSMKEVSNVLLICPFLSVLFGRFQLINVGAFPSQTNWCKKSTLLSYLQLGPFFSHLLASLSLDKTAAFYISKLLLVIIII